MSKAFRGHTRDLIAVFVIVLAGIATTLVIISQQKASLPAWVPVLGEDFFELKAEFLPAQAITPGQGQAVQIAGITVGKVGNVELEDGRAVVRMDVETEYAPLIHRDASLLLRPKTGLADMIIQVDPGKSGPLVKEGDTIPLASTKPQVNADEVLATLDLDTRNYLTLLLQGASEGLGTDEKALQASAALRRLEPTVRDIARVNGALAERRRNLARVIHNFGLLAEELGRHDQQLATFVDANDQVFESFARQQASIRSTLRELPSTLAATNKGLGEANQLSLTMREALPKLIPSAAVLEEGLESTQQLFTETTPPIRDQIRPFTRQVRAPVRHLTEGSIPLKKTVEGLKTGLSSLNYGLNELAYNPNSSAANYLFYLGWLNHNFNSVYLNQDAYGPLRHGLIFFSCQTATISTGVVAIKPFLKTLQQITAAPTEAQACN